MVAYVIWDNLGFTGQERWYWLTLIHLCMTTPAHLVVQISVFIVAPYDLDLRELQDRGIVRSFGGGI